MIKGRFIILFFVCVTSGFLYSNCINWAHVVEHKQVLNVNDKSREKSFESPVDINHKRGYEDAALKLRNESKL